LPCARAKAGLPGCNSQRPRLACRAATHKGECHPSHERLAKLAACSVSTIQRSLKRLEDAGHIQRKNNIKGKIFLLTDVTAKGQILRKNKIIFAPRNPRPMTPPRIQDIVSATSSLSSESEDKFPPDDDPPF